MLKRKVILSRDSVLWYAGEAASSFAIIESGKLGITTEKGLVAVLRPNMVVGDTSVLAFVGMQPKRLATIRALEEGTTVTEYPPSLLKHEAGEEGHVLWKAILLMVLGQVCRNGLVLVAAHEKTPFLARPFGDLVNALMATHRDGLDRLATWDDFLRTYRFLSETRDYTDAVITALVGPDGVREHLLRATEMTQQFLEKQAHVPFLAEHLAAASERWDLEEALEKR